jgi:hydrogenase expression/formation protein HypC
MCLAIPATVVMTDGSNGLVDLEGNRLKINTSLVPDARAGDCVLVHAGFAIQKLDAGAAAETFALIRRAADDRTTPP